jgi:hypothetical protein
MLTDIFAYRYQNYRIWDNYSELEVRMLNQTFGIINEIFPYWDSEGKEKEAVKQKWKRLHDQLAHELGVDELAQRYYSYTKKNGFGADTPVSGWFSMDHVCGSFIKAPYPSNHTDPDRFIKERLSFIELAFRLRGDEILTANASLPSVIAKASELDAESARRFGPLIRGPGRSVDGVRSFNTMLNETFASQVFELNERFRRAGAPLNYHNGFIQVAKDNLIEENIAKPFWDLVASSLWVNVDIDIKEALDRRDSNDKDPALFAAKALESAIKIISDKKGWTHGGEKGAVNYIDNLVSKANGRFISVWESEMLKDYFGKVRNPLGHGPGSAPMPALTAEQTDWAIETAMSWVRTLVRRF